MIEVIGQLLENSADEFGAKTALQIKRGKVYEKVTYGGLRESAEGLSEFLSSNGIKKGDRVAIFCENSPEWGIAYFATLLSSAIVVGIDIRLKKEEIQHILSHSEAKLVFTSSKCKESLSDHDRIVLLDESIFKKTVSSNSPPSEIPVDPEDMAMLVYTSGTTGVPKAVTLTHKNIVSNVLGAYEVLPAKSSDSFLSVLPLTHMFELVGGFLGPLYSGATITYVAVLKTTVIQETMKETKTTIMQGVPLLFKLIHKGILRRVDTLIQPIPFIFSLNMRIARTLARFHVGRALFRSVRKEFGGHIKFFVSGGAALEAEISLAFEYMGMPILQGYGLTETSPIVSVNTLKAHKTGSVGKPLPGVDISILEDGEITVTGPNVMKGYYRNAEATSSVLKEHVFHTGDIGFLDENGFLHITGRKKNIIVTTAGKNIYPEEIEAVLGESPYISEICVIGKRHHGGEKPYAFIIPDYDYFGQSGMEKDDSTVRETLQQETKKYSESLADYKQLSDFTIFKGEFPKTTTRKIKRHELGKMTEESGTSEEAEEIREDFVRKLRSLVAEIVEIPEETITLDSDLGIDSLLRVEILTVIDKEFSISIPDEASYKIQTLGDIVRAARERERDEAPVSSPIEQEEDYGFLEERSSLREFIKNSLFMLFKVFVKWYFDLEVKGSENIADLKSFVITPNHNSLLDVPIVLSTLPRNTAKAAFSPAARDYFFDGHPIRRWLITLAFNTFPFDRYGNFTKGLNRCRLVIEKEKPLILFPEGTRSVTGRLGSFKVGLGALAFDLDIPVVPTYIRGIHEAFGKGMRFPRPNKIKVYFGKPLLMESYRKEVGKTMDYKIYQKIIEDVRADIIELM